MSRISASTALHKTRFKSQGQVRAVKSVDIAAARAESSGGGAVVTGADRGLGKEIALMLAQRGHRVLVTDLDEVTARATAAEIGGDAVRKVLDRPRLVTTLPGWRGALVRLGDTIPALGLGLLPLVVAQGRRTQRRLLARREGQ